MITCKKATIVVFKSFFLFDSASFRLFSSMHVAQHSLRVRLKIKRKVNEDRREGIVENSLRMKLNLKRFSIAADVNWSSWKNKTGKNPCVNFLVIIISSFLYKKCHDSDNFEINN